MHGSEKGKIKRQVLGTDLHEKQPPLNFILCWINNSFISRQLAGSAIIAFLSSSGPGYGNKISLVR